ncbi:MAG: DNA repair protein RadA/Sm [Hyphomonadaceae bacterium]|nr:MAG: DNA repair protein RadA/Sm [Hyphomonadaceae bacterium]KAF0185398.1 MAG: DNA repair protein RadA/Sm [Hyphomonadaceae bacterium]
MSKSHTSFTCQSCGSVYGKWQGRCDDCGGWNTITEEALLTQNSKAISSGSSKAKIDFFSLDEDNPSPPRIATGNNEFDRVCGGGLVRASAVLLGGDPGIGKSTILMQVLAGAAKKGAKALYISGEESISQIQDRAKRLNIQNSPINLATETELGRVLAALKSKKPDIAIIDSIQTMWTDTISAAPGTVAQVRTCAHELVRFAKSSGCAIILVGHVTKDGQIAGPRVVEHLVDAVLQFEGERGHHFRILRGLKNRYGATDEIGVFEMAEAGLVEVPNPSALFLDERGIGHAGSAVFAGIEGTRPILVEIQALAAKTTFGSPRRAVVGWEPNRLAMLLAVIETRCGIAFGGFDIYLNVAGGMKISEPAADLAVAAALISAISGIPLPDDSVVFGEIALSGDVRSVPRVEARMKEAEKLGFTNAIIPQSRKSGTSNGGALALLPTHIERLKDLVFTITGEYSV